MPLAQPLLAVSENPWLRCALLAVFFVYLPGAAWAWARRHDDGAAGATTAGRCFRDAAGSVLTGLLVALFATLLLAEAGALTLARLAGLVGAVAAAGLVAGWRRDRVALLRRLVAAWPGALLLALGVAGVMLLPRRGEWMVGGWDPGTYVMQGVAVSRTGSFRFGVDPVFSLFSTTELASFTRLASNYTEAFPVVPLDAGSRTLEHFFFRLTPTLIALFDLCGGLRAATRVNEFMGLIALVVFPATVWRLTGRAAAAVFAGLALFVQPVWLYHLHIPTSEVLQCVLLCGVAAAALAGRSRSPLLLPPLLFAAMLNRFSFLPFGAVLLVLLAASDLARDDRRRVARERIAQIAAVAAGALYAYATNFTTLGRLRAIVPVMVAVFCAGACGAVAIDVLGGRDRWRSALHTAYVRWAMPAGLCVSIILLAVACLVHGPAIDDIRTNLQLALPFLGAALPLLALAGAALLAATRDDGAPTGIRTWALFLMAATVLTVGEPKITRLMPWATRRYVEFTVPLMAMLAGVFLGWLWERGAGFRAQCSGRQGAGSTSEPRALPLGPSLARTLWPRALALGLALGAVAGQRATLGPAWTCTEYNGVSERLAAIAQRIEPGDIVVADHFLWATPLRLIYGKPMVNGELYLDPAARDTMAATLDTLARLSREGRRIRFLTSTSGGLDVFPIRLPSARLDWTSEPWKYEFVRHVKTAREYGMRSGERVFRLYTWVPEDGWK